MKYIRYPIYRAFCKFLEIAVSRKFLVFWVCTYLLINDLLPASLYIAVPLAILGVQTALEWNKPKEKFDLDKSPPDAEMAAD